MYEIIIILNSNILEIGYYITGPLYTGIGIVFCVLIVILVALLEPSIKKLPYKGD